jgi:hypothetical protein
LALTIEREMIRRLGTAESEATFATIDDSLSNIDELQEQEGDAASPIEIEVHSEGPPTGPSGAK